MAQLNNFYPSAIEPSKSFQVIPIGEYLMVFTDSEMKTTKNNTGSYLQLTAEIIDGEYQRRRVWARLNLDNPNQTAVDIAKRDLSAICHALNLGTTIVQDSSQLYGIPFIGELKFDRHQALTKHPTNLKVTKLLLGFNQSR